MSISLIEGTAAVLGDHVSADVILPARYSFLKPEQMAENVLMDLSPEANKKVRENSIIIAGEAFGYGTGRESPSRSLRAAGVRAVIAKSFSRLFFRNAINNGIVVIQCSELVAMPVKDGDHILVSLEGYVVWNDHKFIFSPITDVVSKIVDAGSLINYGRELLMQNKLKI